jgi:PAS domain S-box-containing protein
VVKNIDNTIDYSKNVRLLYVEDNEDARQATLLMLEEFFDHIIVAINGADGYQKFLENEVDLIITDINMPKLNGLEMASKIKEHNTEIPILVLSAYNESDYFMKSIRLGIEGYLLKPIEMDQFVEMLHKVNEKMILKEELEKNIHFLHQYQEATDHSVVVSKSDPNGVITYVNDEFCKISEYSKEELIGQSHNIIRHPDNPPSLFKELWQTIKDEKSIWKGVIRNRSKSGKSYYVNSTIKPILDPKGNIVEYIALRDDITDIMHPKRQLNDFVNTYEDLIVIFVKIDHYEDIEKNYCREVAYEIEQRFAKILFDKVKKICDFEKIYPLDEGEYVLAIEHEKCDLPISTIIHALENLQKEVARSTIDLGEYVYDISILISLSYVKNALENAKYGMRELLSKREKFIVSNELVYLEQIEAQKNLQTLKMVQRGLEDHRIISYFLPIIDGATHNTIAYESLVRLVDIDGKVLPPAHFLETAKRGQYYPQITQRVLHNSINALLYNDTTDISINLALLDLEHSPTRENITHLLKKHALLSHRIIFEIDEGMRMNDLELCKEFIAEVRQLGAKIAIDNFGNGCMNFRWLLEFAPDIIKIDGSLIIDIYHDDYAKNIVETIVSFAKSQDILTIAEFVESKQNLEILKQIGVDLFQGYYFGEPAPLR